MECNGNGRGSPPPSPFSHSLTHPREVRVEAPPAEPRVVGHDGRRQLCFSLFLGRLVVPMRVDLEERRDVADVLESGGGLAPGDDLCHYVLHPRGARRAGP